MKNYLLPAMFALLPVAAQAADLPKRSAAPAAPAVMVDWSGFFIGVQAGGMHHRNAFGDIGFGAQDGNDAFDNSRQASIIGGGHIGYNRQMGAWVVGVIADVDLGGAKVGFRGGDWAYEQEIRAQGSLRGRVGYAAGRFLPYLTAGAAIADLSNVYLFEGSQSISETRIGWTAGAGLAYAIDSKWSALIEYRYTDFGRFTHYPTVWQADFLNTHHVTTQAVRVGVSYRF